MYLQLKNVKDIYIYTYVYIHIRVYAYIIITYVMLLLCYCMIYLHVYAYVSKWSLGWRISQACSEVPDGPDGPDRDRSMPMKNHEIPVKCQGNTYEMFRNNHEMPHLGTRTAIDLSNFDVSRRIPWNLTHSHTPAYPRYNELGSSD